MYSLFYPMCLCMAFCSTFVWVCVCVSLYVYACLCLCVRVSLSPLCYQLLCPEDMITISNRKNTQRLACLCLCVCVFQGSPWVTEQIIKAILILLATSVFTFYDALWCGNSLFYAIDDNTSFRWSVCELQQHTTKHKLYIRDTSFWLSDYSLMVFMWKARLNLQDICGINICLDCWSKIGPGTWYAFAALW